MEEELDNAWENPNKFANFEPSYYFEIGDVVLIKNPGYGFLKQDVGKYVEVVGYGDYYGREGVKVVSYDEPLYTKYPGTADGVVGYGSFGKSPMILLNTLEEAKKGSLPDFVNKPKHYELFEDVEAIEVIARSLTKEEFRGFCFGNLLKYRLRCGKKDNIEQELAKADKYKELYEKYKGFCHD